MSQQRLEQLKNLLDNAYKLLDEVQQSILVETDPVTRAKFELRQSDLVRKIEQFEKQFIDIQAGQDVPEEVEEILLYPEPNLASGNPFNQIGIVADQWFIGRTSQLRRIRENLAKRNSLILIGPSKIGKTSLLWQLFKAYRAEGRTVLQIDFKMPRTIQEHYAMLTQMLGRSGDTIKEVEKALEEREVTLFIDEFELGLQRGLDAEQLLAFKTLVQNEGSSLQIIGASSKRPSQIYTGPFEHSVPYNFLAIELLGSFTEKEVNSLFDTYLGASAGQFSPEIRKEFMQLTGGHPYKIQRVAYRYYEYLLDPDYNWREAYELDISEY